MTLTQQWRYLNLTRSSFYILFPAKGIVRYRLIISSSPYGDLKGTRSFAYRAFLNQVRSHGVAFGGNSPQIYFVSPKFCRAQNFLSKTYKKNKNLAPLSMCLSPKTLKAG